jgi:signal transduction histidine kinase
LEAWRRYGVGVVLVLLVTGGRLALDPWWGRINNRHLFFLPTVMLAAWFGGFGPGLLATVLSTLALAVLWSDPVLLHSASSLVLYFLVCVAVARLIEWLQVARASAEASRASQKQVLAVVAHDLRSPLSTVKMTSALLGQMSFDGDQVRARLRAIDRAANRMENLIRDLVDATRIEHGELNVEMREERVDTMLQDVVDLFSPLAAEKSIALQAQIDHPPLFAICDRDRVLQVLSNLLGNAIKFSSENGRVTLRARVDRAVVRFEIADLGPGIKPEHVAHIFDPYWKADPRGTGLGLFIARSIVRAHGSELEVASRLGDGSTFSFSLPRAMPSAERAAVSWRQSLEH